MTVFKFKPGDLVYWLTYPEITGLVTAVKSSKGVVTFTVIFWMPSLGGTIKIVAYGSNAEHVSMWKLVV